MEVNELYGGKFNGSFPKLSNQILQLEIDLNTGNVTGFNQTISDFNDELGTIKPNLNSTDMDTFQKIMDNNINAQKAITAGESKEGVLMYIGLDAQMAQYIHEDEVNDKKNDGD